MVRHSPCPVLLVFDFSHLSSAGLYALITYYIGTAQEQPVFTAEQRQRIIDDWVQQVAKYGDHPAILLWGFGNELNGWWNGFPSMISDGKACLVLCVRALSRACGTFPFFPTPTLNPALLIQRLAVAGPPSATQTRISHTLAGQPRCAHTLICTPG